MKTTLPYLCVALLGLAGLSGCSTVDSRIQENPGLFASLTPDQQSLVKQGKVGIGFDTATVRLALGEPTSVNTRTTPAGVTQVWHYTRYMDDDGEILYMGYYHRYWGLDGWAGYPYYLDYPDRRPHDYFRVEFKAGRVISIEEETPTP